MNTEFKTSDEWQKTNPNIIVLDPDGWDRANYQFSWFEEKISLEEYERRILYSTCIHNLK